jgi:copper(I)-binding protein
MASLGVALILAVAACGDDEGGVSIDGAWSRAGAATQETAAVYMELRSAEGDTLIGAAVDSSIAGMVGIHQTVMMSDDMSEDSSTGGAMTMEQVERIAIPQGGSVSLEPGGFHIMMMGLAGPLTVGDTFDLTLRFEMLGEIVVQVEVREDAP